MSGKHTVEVVLFFTSAFFAFLCATLGNPALFNAILAHPPKTINGRFRVTEQV
jgi:hypothetical protein